MGGISDEVIRERAYHIWEREGRPHGREYDHWVQAQVELAAESMKGNGGRKAVAAGQSSAPRKERPAMPSKSAAPPVSARTKKRA
jgi:hypothetical protein